MNLRHLADFLRGNASTENFLNEINSEVDRYRQGMAKKGSSIPIYVTEDNFHRTCLAFNKSPKKEHLVDEQRS